MSEQIKVGDLVMVVRPYVCCGKSSTNMGEVGKVVAILNILCRCPACHFFGKEQLAKLDISTGLGTEISRLKRLDPDALKDDVPTREELTA